MSQDSLPEPSPAEALPEVRVGRRQIRIFLGILLGLAAFLGLAFWFSLPETIDEYSERGWLHLSRERYAEAAEDFSAAIDLAWEEGQQQHVRDLLVLRALAYNNSGQYQGAIDDITAALSYVSGGPGSPLLIRDQTTEWYLIRANAYLGAGQPEKAMEDARVVLKSRPGNESARHIVNLAEQRIAAREPL
jgi:tetratricopeptide (TPR) repeat protein